MAAARAGRRGLVALTVAAALTAACTVERVKPGPASSLDVLGPRPDIVAAGLDGSWKLSGGGGQLSVERYEDVPGLRLQAGSDPYTAVRRVDVRLGVSPYLTWSWRPEEHPGALHAVRIVAGFLSAGRARATDAYEWFDEDLPEHDRVIELAWSRSALERGTYRVGDQPAVTPPLYIVRGGREGHDRWWFEAVDLLRLYAQAWPGEDVHEVRVAFLGFRVGASAAGEALSVSGLRLSR